MQMTAPEYLDKIASQLRFIQKYYLKEMNQNDIQVVTKFERVFQYVKESYKVSLKYYQNGFTSEAEIFSVYGYFLQTIKKFKRSIENQIYVGKTDYQASLDKLLRMEVTLTPVYTLLVIQDKKQLPLTREQLLDVNLAHHSYTKQELVLLSLQIFEYLRYQDYNIDPSCLNILINEMSINYNVVPYHNFTHAFQLTQLLFSCYSQSKLKSFVTPLEILIGAFAGLAHDLNHKGVNNGYKIKKSKKLNILTSETAVLENMHCATFFNIISLNRKADVFAHLRSEEEKTLAKRLIITCILATDMGKHFKLLGKFQKRVETTTQYGSDTKSDELMDFTRLTSERADDRQFVLNIMVHACDISNPCMGFENYMNWSYLLSQEFQDQTLKEGHVGLEVTGFLQYKDKPTFYGGQIGFSKSLVLPLWTNVAILFPELQFLPDNINKNLEILAQLKSQA